LILPTKIKIILINTVDPTMKILSFVTLYPSVTFKSKIVQDMAKAIKEEIRPKVISM